MGVSTVSFEKMSDRQLVETIKASTDPKQIAAMRYALYARYEKFVHKHWHKLSSQLNASRATMEVKDDFYNESFVTFTTALDAVSVTKIRDNNWKFLGYYGFYLSNQRKSFARKVIQKHRHETSLEAPNPESPNSTIYLSDMVDVGRVPSAEEIILEQEGKAQFWKAVKICREKLWDTTSNAIFDARLKKTPIKTICTTLGISPWKYNKVLTQMRQDLDKQLR